MIASINKSNEYQLYITDIARFVLRILEKLARRT